MTASTLLPYSFLMQDLKHLLKPEKTILQRYWKSIITCLALAVLIVPALLFAARKGVQAVSAWQHNSPKKAERPITKPVVVADMYTVADRLLPSATAAGSRLSATAEDGTLIDYSIVPQLQQQVQSYLNQTNPLYAVLVAVEPSTGRILSLASHSSTDTAWPQTAAYQVYPMASLFKMITAAAALENNKVNPETVMEFRGRLVSETPKNWDPHPKGRNLSMNLTDAMGKSVNPVYGLVASELVGKEQLQQACNRFGFNKSLLMPGVPALPSPAPAPQSEHELRLQGCGLDHDLKVSPIHAAIITAAIANNGSMPAPRLVDRAVRNGKELPLAAHRELARVIRPETSASLTRMLLTTVTTGTSRKAFRTHDGKKLLSEMKIAAKTGSIDGDNPKGHYSWFAAYAPAAQPKIALVALVINGDKWKIKASHLGERALSEYFRAGI